MLLKELAEGEADEDELLPISCLIGSLLSLRFIHNLL
jgi:hypothetical protein